MKNFFGSIFINRDKLREAGINYPIKVEYYEIIDENIGKIKNQLIYGIQIIKTEYRDKIRVEQGKVENITNNEGEINKILKVMKRNEVTPVGIEEIIVEIKNIETLAKNKKISYNT